MIIYIYIPLLDSYIINHFSHPHLSPGHILGSDTWGKHVRSSWLNHCQLRRKPSNSGCFFMYSILYTLYMYILCIYIYIFLISIYIYTHLLTGTGPCIPLFFTGEKCYSFDLGSFRCPRFDEDPHTSADFSLDSHVCR